MLLRVECKQKYWGGLRSKFIASLTSGSIGMVAEQKQKAYLIGEHPDFTRVDESGEITGLLYVQTGLGNLRLAYCVAYKDGTEILVFADAKPNFTICSEDVIADRLGALVARYKRELGQRGDSDKAKEIYEEIKRLATPRLLIDFLEQVNK